MHSQYRQETGKSVLLRAPVALPSAISLHWKKAGCVPRQILNAFVQQNVLHKRFKTLKSRNDCIVTKRGCPTLPHTADIVPGVSVLQLVVLWLDSQGWRTRPFCVLWRGCWEVLGVCFGHSGKPAYGAFFHTSPSTKGHLNNRQCCIFGQENHAENGSVTFVSVLCLPWLVMPVQAVPENKQR